MDKPEITKITWILRAQALRIKAGSISVRSIAATNSTCDYSFYVRPSIATTVACARTVRWEPGVCCVSCAVQKKLRQNCISFRIRTGENLRVLRQHVVFISGTWQNCETRLSRGRCIDIPHAMYVESRKLHEGWALQSAFPRNKLPSDKRRCG